MSTVIDLSGYFAQRRRQAARVVEPASHPYMYTAIYVRSDVSGDDLADAIAGSGLRITTGCSGFNFIHRSPTPPKDAA